MNLNQVTIPSSDIKKSIDFYVMLGLQLIVHSNDRYARFMCPDGDATLSLHLVKAFSPAEGAIIYFEVNDLDQTVKNLKAAGIAFEVEPVDQPWLWKESLLRDPDGNKIILYHAGKNRRNPPWRLEANDQ